MGAKVAAVGGSLCEAAGPTAPTPPAPPGCGICSVVLAGCGIVRGFVFTMAAAVGGATTLGILIVEAAEDGPVAEPAGAGAEMTIVPGAGPEVPALTIAGDVERLTGFIWDGAAAVAEGGGGGAAAPAGGTAGGGADVEGDKPLAVTAVDGGVLMATTKANDETNWHSSRTWMTMCFRAFEVTTQYQRPARPPATPRSKTDA